VVAAVHPPPHPKKIEIILLLRSTTNYSDYYDLRRQASKSYHPRRNQLVPYE
jgi:hypothetical protein